MTGVRPAAVSDVLALCDLYLEFHEFHAERIPERLCSLRPMRSAEMACLKGRLREIVAGGDADILVAEADGTISGFSEVYLREDEGTATCRACSCPKTVAGAGWASTSWLPRSRGHARGVRRRYDWTSGSSTKAPAGSTRSMAIGRIVEATYARCCRGD
jgi:hypothetical protein